MKPQAVKKVKLRVHKNNEHIQVKENMIPFLDFSVMIKKYLFCLPFCLNRILKKNDFSTNRKMQAQKLKFRLPIKIRRFWDKVSVNVSNSWENSCWASLSKLV